MALERELQELRRAFFGLREALDPLVSARKELDASLARAEETRAGGRARAEWVRAEALSRAQRVVARGEYRAQEIVRRGNLDAERIEARAHADAEEIVLEAQRRLQAAASRAELSGPDFSPIRPELPVEAPTPSGVHEAEAPRDLAPGDEARVYPDLEVPETGELLGASEVEGLQRSGVNRGGPDGLDGSGAAVEGTGQGATDVQGDESTLRLSVSSMSPKELRCTLEGSLSFAGLLALEKAIGGLPRVRSVRVSPAPGGAALSIATQQPDETLQDLLTLSGFDLRRREE